MKRLRQVVVAAGFEAANAVLRCALHGQEQHGRLDAVAAQLRAELDAVHVRHHDVEHDEVERLGTQAREPRCAVVRDLGAIALGFEVLADASREMLLVVDDENSSRRLHTAAPAGQCIATVAPRPNPALSACTVPPESSTRRFTMYRPRPVPGVARRSSSPSRWNFSKIMRASSGGKPRPSSLTASTTPSAARLPSTRIEPLLAAAHDFSALSSKLRSPVSTTTG